MKVGAKRAKMCMQRVNIPTELPFLHTTVDGWFFFLPKEELFPHSLLFPPNEGAEQNSITREFPIFFHPSSGKITWEALVAHKNLLLWKGKEGRGGRKEKSTSQ